MPVRTAGGRYAPGISRNAANTTNALWTGLLTGPLGPTEGLLRFVRPSVGPCGGVRRPRHNPAAAYFQNSVPLPEIHAALAA